MKKTISKLISTIATIVIVLIILTLVPLTVPKLFGIKLYGIMTESMSPQYNVGGVVYVKSVEASSVKIDDVITYRTGRGEESVTHRVIGIEGDKFVTKGDANNVEDNNPVPYEKVVGHAMSKLPYAGYVVIYIKTPIGIACVCGLLFILILLTFLPNVLSKEGDKKGTKEE